MENAAYRAHDRAGIARRRYVAYAALLSVVLGIQFSLALAAAYARKLPASDVLVAALMVSAVGMLLWLDPRPRLFGAGLALLAAVLLLTWLGSPKGALLLGRFAVLPPNDPYATRVLANAMLLFPVAWFALAASVASWRVGLVSYIVAGLGLALMASVTGLLGSPFVSQQPHFFVLFASYVLLWPQSVLVMLGAFGHSFG